MLSILSSWFDDMAELESALMEVRQIPVLLLWGDRDRAVAMESAQQLRLYFDQSEFIVLPGTGHLPYEECPETLIAGRELLPGADAWTERGRAATGAKRS